MNKHPVEHIPGFVLGALDAETTRLIDTHLQQCPPCRHEADTFRQHVEAGNPGGLAAPPIHVKHHLMQRIHASNAEHSSRAPLRSAAMQRPAAIWLASLALTLALVFGVMMVDAQQQLRNAQQTLQQANLSDQQITAFLSNPATVSQELHSPDTRATARMYMQVGHNRAVLIVSGLPAAASGTTYQFWFATATTQVPSATFAVDASGTARLVFDAPQPVDTYGQVMVTVEPRGGSVVPSSQIVLAADIVAVRFAW